MSDTRRIYHPTLDAYKDVPKKSADAWKAAGWRMTRPDHVTEPDVIAPEEQEPVIVTVTDATPSVASKR